MLTIVIPQMDIFNDDSQQFSVLEEFHLELEHSLISLSKWESFFEKPFMETQKKTTEETLAYIRFMALDERVPAAIFDRITNDHMERINAYITAKMTATWFGATRKGAPNPEIVTAELLYYWMFELKIPMECQHWHLNRLLTQIEVCNKKNAPAKKTNRSEMISDRKRMNAERKAKTNSTG